MTHNDPFVPLLGQSDRCGADEEEDDPCPWIHFGLRSSSFEVSERDERIVRMILESEGEGATYARRPLTAAGLVRNSRDWTTRGQSRRMWGVS